MLGHLMEWLYSGIGGIRQQENAVAFKEIRIEPELVGDLTSAEVSYHSLYGEISSKWKKTNNAFEIQLNIPVNTTAVVYLPVSVSQHIVEEQNSAFKTLGSENGRTKISIGSGYYKFNVK